MSQTTLSEFPVSETPPEHLTPLENLTLPEDLTRLGFSPELAAVISPDEFRAETERAWNCVLQELKGEKPTNNGGPLTLNVLARPATLSPSPIPTGEGRGEGRDPLSPSPIPIASAPAVSAEAANADKAAEGRPATSSPRLSSPKSVESGEGSSSATAATAPTTQLDTLSPTDPATPSPIPMGEGRGEGGLSDADRFPFLTAAQLNSGQFETRYLIPGILAAAQPGGIFGAFKTLKTSLTAELLISLASGTPFLGHFAVPEPGRALFLSGESGLDALQSIARRICAARGLALETLDNFELCPKLPNLDSPDDLRALGQIVRDKKPACLAIDPAYLAIRGEDARNLFAMGALLRPLADLCNETGCAILIVHHCKRTRLTPGDPATLDDIAWSGFAEFSAQWLLLSRRRRFDPDTGHHELWFSAGGRSGHHGLCALDVDEGVPTDAAFVPSPIPMGEGQGEGRNSPSPSPMGEGPGEGRLPSSAAPNGGRIWKTTLLGGSDVKIQNEIESVEVAESRRQLRTAATNARHRRRILELLREKPAGETARCFRETLGLTTERTHVVLRTLVDDGLIEYANVFKRDRWEVGFKLSGGKKIPAGDKK